MTPRREAAPFWQVIQRHSTPPRPLRTFSDTEFGPRQNCPNTFRNACPDWTEISVRNDFRIRCPNNSEIPVRISPKYALPPKALQECLNHLLKAAGNAKLLSPSLVQTLCEHAAGNLRLLMNMANDLLVVASQQEREVLDEKLFFEVFSLDPKPAKRP